MYLSEGIKCRILWLSDIHYRGDKYYGNRAPSRVKERLKILFNSFFDRIVEIQGKQPIDYIFLTGDIGFSGSYSDYQSFWKAFISPLHTALSKKIKGTNALLPKIVTIPGNHDIDRKDVAQFENFLSGYNSVQSNLEQQYEHFNRKDYRNSYLDLFKNYSQFFSNCKGKKGHAAVEWKNLFHIDISKQEKYADKRLYGYFVDDERQLIIVLLNSAWFSIGDEFNKLLVNDKLKRIEINEIKENSTTITKLVKYLNERTEKHLNEILKMKDMIAEYGNQIIGRDLFPIVELKETIAEKPEYVVITCMHHPQNWLSWGESYNYREKPNSPQKGTLNKIIDNTDILLTGHEHVPITKMPEMIDVNDSRWHIKAGMFMEDKIDVIDNNKDYFEHSRFSVLDIDLDKYRFTEQRYLFDKDRNEWCLLSSSNTSENTNYLPLRKKSRLMNRTLKKELLSKISFFDIEKFLRKRYEESSYLKESKIYSNFIQASFRNKADPSEIRICIFPTATDFKEKLYLPNPFKDHFLDPIISMSLRKRKKIKVHFIWPDFLLNESLFEKYYSCNSSEKIEESYGEIKRFSDMLFNKFRHHYFARFENESNENMPNIDFQSIKGVRFIGEVIPFWKFRRYCKVKKE